MGSENIGLNLRRLRLMKNLSQEKLAQAIGITRAAYIHLENGTTQPRTSTLQAIAKALDVKLADLLQPPMELKAVRFRAKKKLKRRKQVLFKVSNWLRKYNSLEACLGAKQPYVLGELAERLAKEKPGAERAKMAARLAREKMGIEPGESIRDLCGLLESSGIKVYPIKIAGNDFFGLSVAPQDDGPAIVVNVWERISVERWIFSAVHELGHLLLHLDSFNVELEEENPEEEKEADLFAAHFLMPEEVFIKEWEEAKGLSLIDRVMKVKRIFKVSYRTVLYRLYEAGYHDIWKQFYYEYYRQEGQALRLHEEPQALAAEAFSEWEPVAEREPDYKLAEIDFLPDRLALLVREAIEKEQITLSKGAEILGLTVEKMRALANSWVN